MFGDSVTEFGDYPEQVSKMTGATTYKIGFGGCRMADRAILDKSSASYNELSMIRISNSIKKNDFKEMQSAIEYLTNNEDDDNYQAFKTLQSIDLHKIDIITIFFGTNDFTSNENPIGDSCSTNPMEIKGAMNIIIDNLSKFNKPIVFITPTHRFFNIDGVRYDSDNKPNKLGLYLCDYRNAIIEQANYRGVEHIDMYTLSGFNKYNHDKYFRWIWKKNIIDGVHPNNNGYYQIASVISSYIVNR